MLRRDFVRAMVAAGFAPRFLLGQQSGTVPPPPAPVPWTLGLNAKTPLPAVQTADVVAEMDVHFFSATQKATLTRLSDLLVPAIGGKPGALDAEAPTFLDFLIGCSPDTRKDLYTGGLSWLDSQAKAKHHLPFAQLSDAQADALIKPWLRAWMSDHPPTELHADFINIAHADIRSATMNSKAWSDALSAKGENGARGLYWSPIEPDIYATDFRGVHSRPSPVLAAPRASHTTTAYPR